MDYTKDMNKTAQTDILFNSSAAGVREVLCEIHNLILDLNFQPEMDPKMTAESDDDKRIKVRIFFFGVNSFNKDW